MDVRAGAADHDVSSKYVRGCMKGCEWGCVRNGVSGVCQKWCNGVFEGQPTRRRLHCQHNETNWSDLTR